MTVFLSSLAGGFVGALLAMAIVHLVRRHRANKREFQTTSQFLEATDHLDLDR